VLIVDVHSLQGVLGCRGTASAVAPGQKDHGETTCVSFGEMGEEKNRPLVGVT